MGEDVPIGRDVVDLLSESIAYRCDDHSYPVESAIEEPVFSSYERIWCDRSTDELKETEELKYKSEKYPRRDELRYRSDDEHTLRRYISLYDAKRDIETEGYEVRKPEKYSYKDDILQEKCEKKYNRKVKYHPDKSLE